MRIVFSIAILLMSVTFIFAQEDISINTNTVDDINLKNANNPTFSLEIPDEGDYPDPEDPEEELSLMPPYPNPTNPSTTISFSMGESDRYNIGIFNMRGQQVKSYTGTGNKGINSIVWNGTADNGMPVASGVYLIRMQSGSFVGTQKVILLK